MFASFLFICSSVCLKFPDKNIITEMEFLVAPDDGIWKDGRFLFHASFPDVCFLCTLCYSYCNYYIYTYLTLIF